MVYNLDNAEFLENHVGEQCDKQSDDMEANLTLLSCGSRISTGTMKELSVVESECLKTICDIFTLLETWWRFKEAW
ncbi:hypothetical protein T10_2392 [Trichinella papuae]|uniref:Uncharacterized protein n=1 Tax=Trichinella papuae TaxID=268474 RepID=A0A0V1MA69_9BILA|nr:hypothetical protein T10_2392 [Trichinella papuae]